MDGVFAVIKDIFEKKRFKFLDMIHRKITKLILAITCEVKPAFLVKRFFLFITSTAFAFSNKYLGIFKLLLDLIWRQTSRKLNVLKKMVKTVKMFKKSPEI